LKNLSASELVDEITGESHWEIDFGDDGSDAVKLEDADLFDLMFEDSASDSEDHSDSSTESPGPLSSRKFHPAPSCSENECSICFCDFDSCVVSTS